MTKIVTAFFALMIMVGAGSAGAADEQNITCSLTRAFECTPEEGCSEWLVEDMALPRFVRINLKDKTIISLDKNIERNSKITSIDRLGGMIVMHGTELRGWSVALGEDSGDITLSAAGDGEGFIVFGACIAP